MVRLKAEQKCGLGKKKKKTPVILFVSAGQQNDFGSFSAAGAGVCVCQRVIGSRPKETYTLGDTLCFIFQIFLTPF